ncbi:LarC family nickel insertion protein [bacterium]|nr:LarC family nickel insertion protein [bacterium]
MEILFIDPVAGVSGDMFLGALVDLGVDFEALQSGLKALNIDGIELKCEETKRHYIAATKVNVVVEDVPHPHRHLGDLTRIIEKADLPATVKERSIATLTRLAEAESKAHRTPIEKVHLHEVGGLDCLVDVVGTCLGIHLLGVERIYSGPVSLGSGFQKCAHGTMPVPVPGTLAILNDFPVRRTQIPYEMTTPTGAALVATLAHPAGRSLIMTANAIGYGAGNRDTEHVANLLRLVRGEISERLMDDPFQVDHSHDHHHHHHDHEHTH